MADAIRGIKKSLFKRMGVESGAELPTFAWPGGYPIYYLDDENNTLCPKCANKNEGFGPLVEAGDVNWEDSNMTCDQCNQRIESAYAEDEAEKPE